jgi:hypothetical protein
MSELSWAELLRRVHKRANFLCEYCQTAQRIIGQAMHVDHINPDGGDLLDNLCLSCANCNMSKARATTAFDPESQQIVPLFNPRNQIWAEHFEWIANGTVLRGLTPTGRATIVRLQINRERMIESRSNWVFYGLHPPSG